MRETANGKVSCVDYHNPPSAVPRPPELSGRIMLLKTPHMNKKPIRSAAWAPCEDNITLILLRLHSLSFTPVFPFSFGCFFVYSFCFYFIHMSIFTHKLLWVKKAVYVSSVVICLLLERRQMSNKECTLKIYWTKKFYFRLLSKYTHMYNNILKTFPQSITTVLLNPAFWLVERCLC